MNSGQCQSFMLQIGTVGAVQIRWTGHCHVIVKLTVLVFVIYDNSIPLDQAYMFQIDTLHALILTQQIPRESRLCKVPPTTS
mgnify:CR=1 FL=1